MDRTMIEDAVFPGCPIRRERRLRDPHGVSGSSSQGRVRADGSDALLASAYKRLDRMGAGEYRRYHEGQEEGPRALAYDDGHCHPFRMPMLRNERCLLLASKDAHLRKR